ncbi:MAG: phytanoyl-CoA dioxygenase family protein [Burkholderiaceae bacterium]
MTATLLDDTDLARYERDGVIIPRHGLGDARAAEMRAALDRWLAGYDGADADFVPDILEQAPDWLRFATVSEIIEPVRQILGDDVILWGSALFCKSSEHGRATPWHQDGRYWPIRPLATVTAWIAIDPVDTGNGCLRVIPGSHRPAELREHARNDDAGYILNQELAGEDWEARSPMDIVLAPGQFSLHDVYLVHGACANTSGRRRAGLVFRYMPATAFYDRGLAREQGERLGIPGAASLVTRRLYQVSGIDRSGRNDAVPVPAG